MYFEHIFSKKMGDFKKCPNCAKEGLTIPLTEDRDSMVCSLCEYSEKTH
jgi:hypothetical protein